MTDFPQDWQTPVVISSYTRYAAAFDLHAYGSFGAAAITWPTANLAVYVPLSLPFAYNVRSVFWANGSTVTGSVDFGIYNADGARLYSTTGTAQSGATALQFITPTEFLLSAGRYYLGLVVSATTANLVQGATNLTAVRGELAGLLQEALGATTLPASMTPAALTSFVYPLCGISRLSAPAF